MKMLFEIQMLVTAVALIILSQSMKQPKRKEQVLTDLDSVGTFGHVL